MYDVLRLGRNDDNSMTVTFKIAISPFSSTTKHWTEIFHKHRTYLSWWRKAMVTIDTIEQQYILPKAPKRKENKTQLRTSGATLSERLNFLAFLDMRIAICFVSNVHWFLWLSGPYAVYVYMLYTFRCTEYITQFMETCINVLMNNYSSLINDLLEMEHKEADKKYVSIICVSFFRITLNVWSHLER